MDADPKQTRKPDKLLGIRLAVFAVCMAAALFVFVKGRLWVVTLEKHILFLLAFFFALCGISALGFDGVGSRDEPVDITLRGAILNSIILRIVPLIVIVILWWCFFRDS